MLGFFSFYKTGSDGFKTSADRWDMMWVFVDLCSGLTLLSSKINAAVSSENTYVH